MAQVKFVLKVIRMVNEKTKQKAIETAINIYGIDYIGVDMKEQKLTVIRTMDPIAVGQSLKKMGKVEIISVEPAKQEKKEGKK